MLSPNLFCFHSQHWNGSSEGTGETNPIAGAMVEVGCYEGQKSLKENEEYQVGEGRERS